MDSMMLLEPVVKIEEDSNDVEFDPDPLSLSEAPVNFDRLIPNTDQINRDTLSKNTVNSELEKKITDRSRKVKKVLSKEKTNSKEELVKSEGGAAKTKKIRKKYPPKAEPPCFCDICHQEFKSQKNLKHHRRRHTGERPYMCTTCGKRYTQIGHLQNHAVIHTNEKKFPCTHCDKAFFRNTELVRHLKIHTGDKQFECMLCNKKFTQKGNLQCHIRVHNNIRPHECDVCLKKFPTKSKLREHTERHERKAEKSKMKLSNGEGESDGEYVSS